MTNPRPAAIAPRPLPAGALLQIYHLRGAYTDCYAMDLPRRVDLAEYIEAFYTSRVFKVERALLAVLARRPADDAQAHLLAQGGTGRFSAWTVEGREPGQLLLRDFTGSTRSWLMAQALGADGAAGTRLYFGSAVVPRRVDGGQASFSPVFHLLMGFHHVYTRALMGSARARLARAG